MQRAFSTPSLLHYRRALFSLLQSSRFFNSKSLHRRLDSTLLTAILINTPDDGAGCRVWSSLGNKPFVTIADRLCAVLDINIYSTCGKNDQTLLAATMQ